MKRNHSSLQGWALTLSVVLIMLACNFMRGSATEGSPSMVPENTEPASTSESIQGQISTEVPIPDEPGPVDYLLDLRSIQLKLSTLYPDGTSESIQAQIDADGNMHVKLSLPGVTFPDEVKNSDIPAFPAEVELYVVGGDVYQLNAEKKWETTLEPIDYKVELSNLLHGPEGPGLWLNILPEESLQSAGQETVGGFTTEKIKVNGTVADETITGTLWYDVQSNALVQAELQVPAALLSVSEEPAQGEVLIKLEAQKAEVPDITVPTAPNP